MRSETTSDLQKLLKASTLPEEIQLAQIPALLCQLASLQTQLSARLLLDGSKGAAAPTALSPLLTLDDACALLKIQPDYLYRHWKKIPGSAKIAGKIRFTSDGLKRWTEAQRVR